MKKDFIAFLILILAAIGILLYPFGIALACVVYIQEGLFRIIRRLEK